MLSMTMHTIWLERCVRMKVAWNESGVEVESAENFALASGQEHVTQLVIQIGEKISRS